MKQLIPILIIFLLVSTGATGQNRITKNTLRLAKDIKGEPANVTDMGWMNGEWEGNALGGSVKEVWTVTDGGVMMGMFILVKENKPSFYEFMTFSIENGQLFLKLKHFTPDLVGWEDKDKTVDFRFIKRDRDRYYFHGLTFEKKGANGLNLYLALTKDGTSFNEEVFRLRRSGSIK